MTIQPIIARYGYKISEVSKLLGMHENSLSMILSQSKDNNSLSVKTLRKIADTIGCHISEFFEDEPTTKNGEMIDICPADKSVILPEQPEIGIEDKRPLRLDMEQAIRKAGLTNKAVAKKIGISEVAFSMMMKKGNPTYERMQQIADVLGMSIIDLFVTE